MKIDQRARAVVLSAIKATIVKDRPLLDQSMTSWNEETTKLLVTWCTEAITKTWLIFDDRDLFGLEDNKVPLTILKAFNSMPDARPYLKSHVALYSLVSR